jgi:hypothetical protein
MLSLFATALAVGVAGTACSSDDDGSGGPTTGGPAGADGGPSGTVNQDGGTTNLDAGTSSESGPSGPVKSGYVFVSQSTFSGTSSHSVLASFSTTESVSGQGGVSCATRTEGACQVSTCTVAASDAGTPDAGAADAGSGPAFDSAGVVTLSGGQLAAPITLTPSGDDSYPFNSGAGAIFAGGDSIKVSAAGATVPAFESTAAAPGDIVVTSPTFTSLQTTIDKAQPLDVAWTGGGAGNVAVTISGAGAQTVSIQCSFPASGGTGVVPAAALSDLGGSGAISISPSVVTKVQAGDYAITYSLLATGTSGTYTAQ